MVGTLIFASLLLKKKQLSKFCFFCFPLKFILPILLNLSFQDAQNVISIIEKFLQIYLERNNPIMSSHLVNWKDTSCPILSGGLGFRDLFQNQVFLAKWNLYFAVERKLFGEDLFWPNMVPPLQTDGLTVT